MIGRQGSGEPSKDGAGDGVTGFVASFRRRFGVVLTSFVTWAAAWVGRDVRGAGDHLLTAGGLPGDAGDVDDVQRDLVSSFGANSLRSVPTALSNRIQVASSSLGD